jgi:hypothetical protein
VSTLFIGGPLMVVALVNFVVRIVWGGAEARSAGELARVFVFLLAFSAVLGPAVARARRWLGPGRSLHRKNLVTGALVGVGYAVACTLLFGGDLDLSGKLLMGGATCLGLGWAVASGLDEAFAAGPG